VSQRAAWRFRTRERERGGGGDSGFSDSFRSHEVPKSVRERGVVPGAGSMRMVVSVQDSML
jgi:hypothetical protein